MVIDLNKMRNDLSEILLKYENIIKEMDNKIKEDALTIAQLQLQGQTSENEMLKMKIEQGKTDGSPDTKAPKKSR